MPFFKDEEKVTIEFQVDKKRADNYNLARSILEESDDEIFEDFLAMLITKALRKNNSKTDVYNESIQGFSRTNAPQLTEETIRSRIQKWAQNIHSFPHIMIKSYIKATQDMYEPCAYRAKMKGHFDNMVEPSNTIDKFVSIFRQMCSSSSRAYGDIFINDRNHQQVYLNEKYKDLICELRDEFLK